MSESLQIPPIIDNPERIIRVLMDPRHFKSQDIIKWNCFRSPAGIDEVSVIRIEFCSEQFCKNWGKSLVEKDVNNAYYGLAVLLAKEIRDLDSDVIYTPSENTHPYHADIQFGVVLDKGSPPPPEVKYKMEEMARISRAHKDTQPLKDQWIDGVVD